MMTRTVVAFEARTPVVLNAAASTEVQMLRAEAAAATAVASAASAVENAAQTTSDAAATDADRVAAEAAAALADTNRGLVEAFMTNGGVPYANAYASSLPKGSQSITITAAGSGYTNGTYAGGVLGGPAGFAWTYTVTGNTVTSATVTNPGLATATTAPTLSFPLGGGTGATATAAAASTLIPDQKAYAVASSDSATVLIYRNNGGSVAALNNPDGTQISFLNAREFRRFIARFSTWRNTAFAVANPHLLRVQVNMLMADGSTPPDCYVYDIRRDLSTRCVIDIKRVSDNVRMATLVGTASGPPVAGSINPVTFTGANGGIGQVSLPLLLTSEAVAAGFSSTSSISIDWGGGETWGGVQDGTTTNHVLNANNMGLNAAARAVASAIADTRIAVAARAKPWGELATAVPAALAPIKTIKLWNAKGNARRYRVSQFQSTTAQLRVDIFDHDLNDQVGFFSLSTPDYTSGGANLPDRILLTGSDPLGSLPSGDPSGANYTGLQGYLELHKSLVVESGAVNQPTTLAESHIDPANIYTTWSTPAQPRDSRLWLYSDVIEVGTGRTFTTPRAAVESLYTPASAAALAAAPLGVAVQPDSFRATPLNPVLIVIDPGTYLDVNLHLPDWVSLMARYPGTVTFEHSVGATRPIVQAHLNHQLIDIVWRNTVAEGALSGTSSARYAIHRDYLHNYQSADGEGDIARAAKLQIFGGSLIAGAAAQIQPLGMAITVNDTVDVEDVILDTDGSFTGPLLSGNNSSGTIGGGRFNIRNCWDKSGRVANPSTGANSTVAVQTKTNATYPNILNVDGCKGFSQVALSPGTLGSFTGKWLLRGNNSMNVYSEIAGDYLGL